MAAAGCGSSKPAPQAPAEVNTSFLGYWKALRAGDGAQACGLATVNAKEILVGQAVKEVGEQYFPGERSQYCPQVVAGYAESVSSYEIPTVISGSASGTAAEIIVTQPYKDATILKRRVSMQQIDGKWLFDGIYNLALTKQ